MKNITTLFHNLPIFLPALFSPFTKLSNEKNIFFKINIKSKKNEKKSFFHIII